MKKTSIFFSLVMLVALVPDAGAAEKADAGKQPKVACVKRTKAPTSARTEQMVLTGSHLKQTIRRSGLITDGPSQVIYIDNATIRASGAANLRQLLSSQGIH